MPKKNKIVDAPVEADGPQELYLTQEEILRMRVGELEMQLAHANMKIREFERELYLSKMAAEIAARQEGFKQASANYKKTLAQIEARLGVSLSDYSFNDESGLLIPVDK